MKRIAFLSLLPFFTAACFMQGSPGSGAGLGSNPSSIEAGGMAGPPSGASSMSGAGSGGSGDAGRQETADGEQTGGTPSGGPSDPTAGSETPITVVGTPMGGSRKPKPCPENFRLCFHDVKVAPQSPAGDGAVTYGVSGILGMQTTPAGPVDGVAMVFVYLIDLLFPETDWTTATGKPFGDFVATVVSPPGRGLRLQIEHCKHLTTLDLTLPEASAPPLEVDPCGSTEPTDVYTGPPRRHEMPAVFDRGLEFKAQ